MTAKILDGRALAKSLRSALSQKIKSAQGRKPGLAVILVGDDAASHVYVSNKIKACQETGIASFEHFLPANASYEVVLKTIKMLNADPDVDGILMQLPLPSHLNAAHLIQAIDPAKDVDGLTPANIGRLISGGDCFIPCTPQGALKLIKQARQDLTGLHAVVIGRSLLFGKPMGQILLSENCTVTQAHSKTQNLPGLCRMADILIAAVGQAEMVKGDWIKPGAIVIDVGINRLPPLPPPQAGGKGGIVGDVAFHEAATVAAAITPVPGGVGPMTIACLLENTLKAARIF